MRNLKRALSLTLASVMLLGMMVIGTSAASFTDADDISNVTAATVLQELEVMQGSDGKFSPDTTVTRGQMAILICKMLYGSKLNADNFAGTSQFDDVPANAYYTGYVNLASSLGIISGYGNGKFGPGAPVTTAQAALMLTRALGWFQAGELENQTWTSNAIAAVEKATTVNLFGSLRLANDAPLSRDNVCEMVFNALTKTAPVKYNERWDTYYSDDGGNIFDGVKFDYRNTLGYKNFTLVYNTTTDDFGHPATQWGIGTGRIGDIALDTHGDIQTAVIRTSILKAADEATLTYTKDVKLGDIYKDLGKPDMTGKTVTYKVDSVDTANDSKGIAVALTSNNEGKVGAKGALTSVYKKNDGNVVIITVNTYLVKANADYSTKNEELSVTPYGTTLTGSNKIKNDDVTVSQFKKDDLILVTGVKSSGSLTIKTATPATVVENVKISAYKGTKDYVTAGDTKYSYNATAAYTKDTSFDAYTLQKTGYNLVLDKYDYVIGVEKYSGEVTLDDILFVKDADKSGFNWLAKVIFMDGSEATITIAGTQAHNGSSYESVTGWNKTSNDNTEQLTADGLIAEKRFFEFNKKSNGEYELKDITDTRQGKVTANGDDAVKDIDGGKVQPIRSLSKTATNDTIFITKTDVTTGVKNAPSVSNADVYYLLDNAAGNNYILAAYTAKKGVTTVSASEYVYIFTGNGKAQDDKDNTYYTYTAIKDGEKVTDFAAATNGKTNGLYKIETYENGYPVLGTALSADEANVLDFATGKTESSFSYKSGTVTVAGKGGYVMADDAQVYVVDVADKSVDVIAPSSVTSTSLDAGSYKVCAIHTSTSDSKIVVLWLMKGSNGRAAVYTSGTLTASNITSTTSKSIELAGVTIDVATNETVAKVATALGGANSIKDTWTAAVANTNDITLTAKVAGAVGGGVTGVPAAAPDGFTQTTAGVDPAKASKAITLAQAGDKVEFGGVTFTYGDADVSTATAAGDDFMYTAASNVVTITATNAGTAGNSLTVTHTASGSGSSVNLTGGTAGTAAVYTKTGVNTMISGATTTTTEKLTVGGYEATVTGADLSAKLDSFVASYNTSAPGNSDWTASKGSDNASITFTAKAVGPKAGPTGTTLVTGGEAAVTP